MSRMTLLKKLPRAKPRSKNTFISQNVKETISLGARLGRQLRQGDLVALIGIFGAGKTYFTKGIAQGIGIKDHRQITSPSFTLIQVYQGKKTKLYHIDAQRLTRPQELLNLGLADALTDGICVIEWADKCLPFLNKPDIIQVRFQLKNKTTRVLRFSGVKKAQLTYT